MYHSTQENSLAGNRLFRRRKSQPMFCRERSFCTRKMAQMRKKHATKTTTLVIISDCLRFCMRENHSFLRSFVRFCTPMSDSM